MPSGSERPQASCHPERLHYGRNLCRASLQDLQIYLAALAEEIKCRQRVQ